MLKLADYLAFLIRISKLHKTRLKYSHALLQETTRSNGFRLDIYNILHVLFFRIAVECGKSALSESEPISTAIDIPPEFEPTAKFQGTLGHKVNHKFKPTTKYIPFESAR